MTYDSTSQVESTLFYNPPAEPNYESKRRRQLVDWSAAWWAGIIAGLIFLAYNIFVLPWLWGGNMWVMLRLHASVIWGESVLAPPATFDVGVLLTALITHLIFSVLAAMFIAYILHRWGLIIGIIGGALLGLVIYAINLYASINLLNGILDLFGFFILRNWSFALGHIIFGALAGGIYEALEVEEYVELNQAGIDTEFDTGFNEPRNDFTGSGVRPLAHDDPEDTDAIKNLVFKSLMESDSERSQFTEPRTTSSDIDPLERADPPPPPPASASEHSGGQSSRDTYRPTTFGLGDTPSDAQSETARAAAPSTDTPPPAVESLGESQDGDSQEDASPGFTYRVQPITKGAVERQQEGGA
ncbi:MAG: hypothetical protein AAF639_00420 [Chloroflexota bacterium]